MNDRDELDPVSGIEDVGWEQLLYYLKSAFVRTDDSQWFFQKRVSL
jgi:hypothetical protein